MKKIENKDYLIELEDTKLKITYKPSNLLSVLDLHIGYFGVDYNNKMDRFNTYLEFNTEDK